MREMAGCDAVLKSPFGCDRGQRIDDEGSRRGRRMRDCEAAGLPPAPGPGDDIKVEDTASPTAAAAAAKIALDALQFAQHLRRIELACNQRYGIREVTARAAVCLVQEDRRSIEQAEVVIQPRNCGLDDSRGAAEAAVGAIRADRDRIEVRCLVQARAPR